MVPVFYSSSWPPLSLLWVVRTVIHNIAPPVALAVAPLIANPVAPPVALAVISPVANPVAPAVDSLVGSLAIIHNNQTKTQ